MRLLTAEAVFEMPPQPMWLAGRAAVGAFLGAQVLAEPGRVSGWSRPRPTGSPAWPRTCAARTALFMPMPCRC